MADWALGEGDDGDLHNAVRSPLPNAGDAVLHSKAFRAGDLKIRELRVVGVKPVRKEPSGD